MLTQVQYEANEQRLFNRQLAQLCTLSHAEKAENSAEWFKDMLDSSLLEERVHWLLCGNYGYFAMVLAKEAVESKGNSIAQLSQLIGALEWRCTYQQTRACYLKHTIRDRVSIDKAIQSAIDFYLEEMEGE